MQLKKWSLIFMVAIFLALFGTAQAAYEHSGDAEKDPTVVLNVYPGLAGTKLDSCALCHRGGTINDKTVGSCLWCHSTYGYTASGNIEETLNPYGLDYLHNGRNKTALELIAAHDSDDDEFSNAVEIAALRFPGNAADDPTKAPAPYRILTRDELSSQPLHTQFMLMNTTKSGDFYAEYAGVPMAQLLDDSGILASATGITVYAPDGWAQFHSLENDPDPSLYHVYGNYPPADFYYEEEADVESPSSYGWCDYSAPSAAGRYNGDPIEVENGLQLLLAFIRDGAYLDTGKLNDQNKLDGEGPFRVVTPQKVPCPPDQSQKAENQEVVWPYDKNADHNAGFASRSATMIRVEPLPEGTTDIDILEAGWNFVDEAKIIVYGAIDPVPTIEEKLDALMTLLWAAEWSDYKNCVLKWTMTVQCAVIKKMVAKGATKGALKKIENDLLKKTDGYVTTGKVDKNDWIRDSDLQTSAYWAIHEIMILMKILQ